MHTETAPYQGHGRRVATLALLLAIAPCAASAAEAPPPYLDTQRSFEQRAADLVSRMTLEEKAAQMQNAAPAIPRLGVPAYDWWNEALHGVARAGGATVFPQAIGMAATFDVPLMHEVSTAISDEARAKHHEALRHDQHARYQGLTFWSPNINIFRDPRWGRGQETYGEDPFLTARMGVTFVQGLQGEGADAPKNAQGETYRKLDATAKHFAVHSGPEADRHHFDAHPSQRDLHETYLPAFEALVKEGKVDAVMGAYNRVFGESASASKFLLRDVLREQWGFDGYVVSDCWAIVDIWKNHKIVATREEAAALAVKNGTELECGEEYSTLPAAVRKGLIGEADVDKALQKLMVARMRLGMFDPPGQLRWAQIPISVNQSPAHDALARRTARESLVLLKNERGALPLRRGQRLLVVGKSADNLSDQAGGWSLTWQGTDNRNADFPNAQSILAGLREAGGAAQVRYAASVAAAAPGSYDVIVAVIGETPYAEGSGDIVASNTMAHSQRHPEDLKTLQEAAATGKPVITVLLSGRPLYVNDLLNLSQAFVAAWLPGSEGGGVADVLYGGAYDFRGRLGFPWPGQACPPPLAAADPARPPLFALGYGLRYARGGRVGTLPVQLPADCGAATTLPVFNLRDAAPFALKLAARGQERALGADLNAVLEWPQPQPALRVRTVQVNTQQDAKQVTWLAPARLLASAAASQNLTAMAQAHAALQFDVQVQQAPAAPVTLRLGCVRGCGDGIDIAASLPAAGAGKRTVSVPLACFAKRGADLGGIDMPFAIDADAPFAAAFTRIQVVAGAADAPDALRCD